MNSENRMRARGLAVVLALGLLATAVYGAPMTLSNGVPVTGISGAAGSEQFYVIEVPAGQDELEITTSGGTGDVDLYVRRGSAPTTTSYDYRPYKVGNNETVTVTNPVAGAWHIMLKGYTAYTGVTLTATYSAAISIKPLVNGVPVTELAGSAGSELLFSIEVPAGQSKLEISMSGGTGDADLYVKKGAVPTTTSYDYRPFLFGNNETVMVENPDAGTWYIMIRGYTAFAGVTLLASHGGGTGTVLENGVPVTDLSGSAGSEKMFRIDVPAGATNLEFKMSGGTGDADLYVRFGAPPTTTDYDYRPFLAGNNETVAISSPTAGQWYVMIRGYSSYAGVTLKATYSDTITLQDGVPLPDLSGALGSERFFKIEVPSGQSHLMFEMSGGTGNADMYIRHGAKPTTTTWDHRPIQPGNTESISIGGPAGGTWYVMLKGTAAYNGVTLKADYWYVPTVTVLANNVPVKGISGGLGDELFYKIEVPSGQQKLEISISGGTGDADLYIKFGKLPTTSDYDYRPYQIGNDEKIAIDKPQAGMWFIMIRGHQAFSGVTLVATYSVTPPPDEVIVLQNGVAVTGLAGTAGGETFYKIAVPAGQAKLEIMTSGGTGDVDLYVKRGAKPTQTDWDYRPYLIGNNETVTIENPQAAEYFIMLRGYTAYSGVTLKATYFPVSDPITTLENGVPVTGLDGALASQRLFKIEVPASQEFLDIEISGGTGNADLYVRKGSQPTLGQWDYRPYLSGNDEKVQVADPAAATWYIMLHARQAYKDVTLVARYGVTPTGNNFASDPHCVALWRFENQAVAKDSIGTNHMDNFGVAVETTDVKEGGGSGDFRAMQSDWMSIDDDHLSDKFPSRQGDNNVQMSICFWMKPRYFPYGSTPISKYLMATDARSWRVQLAGDINNGYVKLGLGTGSGGTYNDYKLDAPNQQLPKNRWYHVVFTYKDADRTFHVRVWDDTTGVLVYDHVGTALARLAVTNAPLVLGSTPLASQFYDGLLDEVVVFNDILTNDEIDRIRQNRYGTSTDK